MGNVLKADCSAGTSVAVQDISFPGGGWYLQFDVAIPDLTMTTIVAAESGSNNCYTGYFGHVTDASDNVFDGVGCGDSLGDAAGLTSPAQFFDQTGTFSGSGVFGSDTWHTVVGHYDGSVTRWSLDGTEYVSGTPATATAARLRVGGFNPQGLTDEIYYIRDVRAGTTLGGTDLFEDDFATGDLSAWDTTAGSVSVVADPGYPDAVAGDDTTTFTSPVRVGVAFNDTAVSASPTWTYLTDTDGFVASYTINRGRQFEFDKTDGGTATVSINDRDGTLDPTNSASPYFGLIEPLLQIRVELWDPVALQYFTRFRGWIEDFDYVVEPFTHQDAAGNTVGVTRLEISCVDIFAILTAIEMQPDGAFGDAVPAGSEGNIFFDNESAHDRCTHVLTNAGIDSGFYVVFTLNVNMQESVYAPSENVLQVIQDAADAEFPTVSNVYTDRLGRLAIHGRQAKFDPDGVAAGATPGQWLFTRWHAGDGKAVADSPSDTAQIRSLSYNRGLSKVINSALCTPNGIDDTDKTTVTGTDIAGLYYNNAASIAQYGFRSWSAENLFIGAPTGDPLTNTPAGTLTGNNAMDECLAFSTYIVENYKTPRNRVTNVSFRSMRPTASGAAANWSLLCQADISDVVELTVRGPGDTDTSYIFNGEEFFIEGVHEEASPLTPDYANVTLTLDLSPKAYFPIGGGGGVGVT